MLEPFGSHLPGDWHILQRLSGFVQQSTPNKLFEDHLKRRRYSYSSAITTLSLPLCIIIKFTIHLYLSLSLRSSSYFLLSLQPKQPMICLKRRFSFSSFLSYELDGKRLCWCSSIRSSVACFPPLPKALLSQDDWIRYPFYFLLF